MQSAFPTRLPRGGFTHRDKDQDEMFCLLTAFKVTAQSKNLRSRPAVSSLRAKMPLKIKNYCPPEAADQNNTVVVLSDDHEMGSVPWGEFHYAAVISCQRSVRVCRKEHGGRSFQLMRRTSVWPKCLKGRNERRLYV